MNQKDTIKLRDGQTITVESIVGNVLVINDPFGHWFALNKKEAAALAAVLTSFCYGNEL